MLGTKYDIFLFPTNIYAITFYIQAIFYVSLLKQHLNYANFGYFLASDATLCP